MQTSANSFGVLFIDDHILNNVNNAFIAVGGEKIADGDGYSSSSENTVDNFIEFYFSVGELTIFENSKSSTTANVRSVLAF